MSRPVVLTPKLGTTRFNQSGFHPPRAPTLPSLPPPHLTISDARRQEQDVERRERTRAIQQVMSARVCGSVTEPTGILLRLFQRLSTVTESDVECTLFACSTGDLSCSGQSQADKCSRRVGSSSTTSNHSQSGAAYSCDPR